MPGLFKFERDPINDVNNQSSRFRYLKGNLKHHFTNKTHVENWESWKEAEDENGRFESRCHDVGLRIGRLCYDLYKSGSKGCFKKMQ